MDGLGTIQWKFYKYGPANELLILKNNVLSSLGTNVNGSWIAKSVLDNVSLEQAIKITSNPALNSTSKSQAIIDALSNDINFNKIFEVL